MNRKTRPEATKTVSVRLPLSLRQRAKVHAAKNDVSFQAVVIAGLTEYLKKRGD